jgi:Protein of unknown function (DUF1822)
VADLLKNVRDLRLLLPETVNLEPEHFARARQKCEHVENEALSWQIYLNVLAQLSLLQWLDERLPDRAIAIDDSSPIDVFGKIRVNDLKLSAIATEQILDEVVYLPDREFISPELAAHFYVLIEVSEEQEQVTIRGFLRYDRAREYLSAINLLFPKEGYYQLPLSIFETEPQHLLFYCRYLQPSSITESAIALAENLPVNLPITRTKLSNWLEGIVEEHWHAIGQLVDPRVNLAFNTRNVNTDRAVSKVRLINLGMQFGDRTVALIVNIMLETEAKLRILAQLFPTGEEKYLPSDLKITLVSKAGKILQEVRARDRDNYIQLKPFQGELGKRFTLEVSLLEMSLRQDFEL